MSNNDREAIANGRGTRRAPSSSDGSVDSRRRQMNQIPR